ncbi:hypothetical protein M9H77_23741 [Catharanthus roseus]|uniref:Uncharacterized protein n=1 Tax=Catharanthus roseus TaxID=4058 RepID=A0ACC0AYA9_CATRO|nr:hypothetical protein M9H77_23741 [Catharanthus roseus]
MEAVLRSQIASFQNMENHIELIAKRIVEEQLSHIPSNMITLRDVEEQVMTFPKFIDDDDEIAQESEEFTFSKKEEGQQEITERRQDDRLSFEEPPQITNEGKESKRDERLPENKNEFEEGEPEKENENFLESHEDHKEGGQETEIDDIETSEGVNPLTHETNFVLVNDSLCLLESCNKLEENDKKRRPIMEFKGNF